MRSVEIKVSTAVCETAIEVDVAGFPLMILTRSH